MGSFGLTLGQAAAHFERTDGRFVYFPRFWRPGFAVSAHERLLLMRMHRAAARQLHIVALAAVILYLGSLPLLALLAGQVGHLVHPAALVGLWLGLWVLGPLAVAAGFVRTWRHARVRAVLGDRPPAIAPRGPLAALRAVQGNRSWAYVALVAACGVWAIARGQLELGTVWLIVAAGTLYWKRLALRDWATTQPAHAGRRL
jgi:hypothetical protein